MKTCFKCGQTKPLSEFYAHKEMLDGHLNKCKECTKRDVSTHRKEHPHACLQTRIRTHQKRPSKASARRVVEAALAAGVIVKPELCQHCGTVNEDHRQWKLHAHHDDHSQPLDVKFLCPSCHAKADAHKWERVPCPECGRALPRNMMERHRASHVSERV